MDTVLLIATTKPTAYSLQRGTFKVEIWDTFLSVRENNHWVSLWRKVVDFLSILQHFKINIGFFLKWVPYSTINYLTSCRCYWVRSYRFCHIAGQTKWLQCSLLGVKSMKWSITVTGQQPWKKVMITYGQKEKAIPCYLIGLFSQYQARETSSTHKAKRDHVYPLCVLLLESNSIFYDFHCSAEHVMASVKMSFNFMETDTSSTIRLAF